MTHIYIGMSKKVWCGATIRRERGNPKALARGQAAPITEGEYIDGFHGADMCPDCVTSVEAVRGKPTA